MEENQNNVTSNVMEDAPVEINFGELEKTNATEEVTAKGKKPINKGVIIGIIVLLVAIIGGLVGGILLFKDNGKNKGDNGEVENPTYMSTKYTLESNGLETFDISFLQLDNNEKNVVYSPLSIKYALEMLAEGAKGETKQEIINILGKYVARKYVNSKNMSFSNAMFIKDSVKGAVRQNYITNLQKKFYAEIVYDNFETPNVMNKWISDKTFGLIDDLINQNDVNNLDYILVNALAIDMEWINKLQLADNDPEVIDDEYEGESEAYTDPFVWFEYYNSVSYYDSTWGRKFNGKEDYLLLDFAADIDNYDIVKVLGEEKIRKTVTDAYKEWIKNHDSDEVYDFGYGDPEGEKFQKYLDDYVKAIDTNYKKVTQSTDFSFYVDDNVKSFAKKLKTYDGVTLEYVGIMPTKINLKQYIKDLNTADLNNIMTNLKDIKLENFEEGYITKINGSVPEFKFDYEMDLIKQLKQLGVNKVFTEEADLSGLIDGPSSIVASKHKATIDFSRTGIKASAVTFVGGAGDESDEFEYYFDVPVKEIDLTFDKPYMFFIRDVETKEIWFAGSVYEPNKAVEIDYDNYEW